MSKMIPTASSAAVDPDQVAADLHAAFGALGPGTIMYFAAESVAPHGLAAALQKPFSDVKTFGCSTAGEIGPDGYANGSTVATFFPATEFQVETVLLQELEHLGPEGGGQAVRGLLDALGDAGPDNSFAMLLVDGLSAREEQVLGSIHSHLGGIPLIGGSAGDAMKFEETFVAEGGTARSGGAVLAIVKTSRPFMAFKTQHFEPGDTRLVITEADPLQRVVREINGAPAAEEFARVLGLTVDQLDPLVFATRPLILRSGGECYVRSVQQVLPDGSLSFLSMIEEGLVLRLAQPGEPGSVLSRQFDEVHARIGDPSLVVAFDCVLRSIEFEHRELFERIGGLLKSNNAVGFSTYGEQWGAMHVNQTLVGVAIGQ